VNVIAHQTVAEQLERLAFFQIADRPQERQIVAVVEEDRLPTVPTIDHMIDQPIGNRAKWSGHAGKLPEKKPLVNRK